MKIQVCADLKAEELPTKPLLELSRDLQKLIYEKKGGVDHSKTAQTIRELTERLKFNLEAMHQEMAELRDLLPWKSWVEYGKKPYQGIEELGEETLKEIAYELVDLQFFLNNIALALGLTPEEFDRLFYAKYQRNVERQLPGGVYHAS